MELSHDQNRGESHGAEDDGVGDRGTAQAASRIASRWICSQARKRKRRPDWPDLPEDARETLVSLMTRLMLDHAQAAAMPTTAEAGHDR